MSHDLQAINTVVANSKNKQSEFNGIHDAQKNLNTFRVPKRYDGTQIDVTTVSKLFEHEVFDTHDVIPDAAQLDRLRQAISPLYTVDESAWLSQLIPYATPTDDEHESIKATTLELIHAVRHDEDAVQAIDALLLEYSLDTREGVLLMSLAEALIRVPDVMTADALIRDKLTMADFKKHIKDNNRFLVNASTWGLVLTGKIISTDDELHNGLDSSTNAERFLDKLIARMGEPVIRKAMVQAMKIMAKQFVLGQSIDLAIKTSRSYRKRGYSYSFDMLGEAAITEDDAKDYFEEYKSAILSVAKMDLSTHAKSDIKKLQGATSQSTTFQGNTSQANASNDSKKVTNPVLSPSVSIKLSALHPRYEATFEDIIVGDMAKRLKPLLLLVKEHDVDISIDAEEADRLEVSLSIFEKLFCDPELADWQGFGIVVQGYQKRALSVLAWLAALAKAQNKRIPVRLVKGAYWDTEIKLAQEHGLSGYPVYTRKAGTDTAYLACARFLMSNAKGHIWPQFATHNAQTIACVINLSKELDNKAFEFQRLHGMGDALYDHIIKTHSIPVRIYAPVGAHADLLPYLVRRLLENGANSSFVHQLIDDNYPAEKLAVHPVDTLKSYDSLHNNKIPLPRDIFTTRKASFSPNIFIESQWQPFHEDIRSYDDTFWQINSLLADPQPDEKPDDQPDESTSDKVDDGQSVMVKSPYDHTQKVADAVYATPEQVECALQTAKDYQQTWAAVDQSQKSDILHRIANSLEEKLAYFVALCQREAGKTIQDSIDEVREAVDFCRYYANQSVKIFAPISLLDVAASAKASQRSEHDLTTLADPDFYAGEGFEADKSAESTIALEVMDEVQDSQLDKSATDQPVINQPLQYRDMQRKPRGVFACISPWNFPLAIFTGQVVAALTTGNTVVAKPAEQTSMIAYEAVRLMHEAGIPEKALQLVLGGGDVGQTLTKSKHLAGVIFTGSTPTAHHINKALHQTYFDAIENDELREPPVLIAETGGLNAMFADSTCLPEQLVKDAILSAFGSAGQRCSALRVLCVQKDIAAQVKQLIKGHVETLYVGKPQHRFCDVASVIDKGAQEKLLAHIEKFKDRIIAQATIDNEIDQNNATFVPPTVIEVDSIAEIGGEHFGPIMHVLSYDAKDLDKTIDAVSATGFGLTMGMHTRNETRATHIEQRARVGNSYVNRNQTGAVVGVQPFGGRGLSGTGPKAGGPHYLPRLTKLVASNSI